MTAISNNINDYEITPRKGGDQSSLQHPENTVYKPDDAPSDVVRHIHPAAALWHSFTMAVGQDSQIAPLNASIDDVVTRVETIAETIEEHLVSDVPETLREKVRDWSRTRSIDHPFAVAARYAVLNALVKAALYEWYTHRGDLPILTGDLQHVFADAADLTGNTAFETWLPDDIMGRLPHDIVAEISWWRYGLLTADNPPEALGCLFEKLIPAEVRETHGQFRTPHRISDVMRELAIRDGDRVLDAGMGTGGLSIPRNRTRSVHVYGIEQSRLGFLMAVTALALTEQPGIVHNADFFDVMPATLGHNPDAAIGAGRDSHDVDVVPGQVDVAIGNPPYIANRCLNRETDYYRQHLHAFGEDDRTPYVDGDKKLSGRSDLFVYFITHATQFLTDGGRLVVLLPKKWMETQYGRTLQTFLLDHYKLSAVIEFDEAVFDDVQVDAVLLVAERCADLTTRRTTTTRFITINSELTPAAIGDLVTGDSAATTEDDDRTRCSASGYRIITESQSVLEEHDTSDGPLAQYFRESETLQSLTANELFVSLDTLASVTYGQKTGNNDIFLLDDGDLETWPLADQFYTAAVDDIGGVTGYQLTASNSDTYMLDVHAYVDALDKQGMITPDSDTPTQQVKHALARDGYETLLAYIDQWEDTCDEETLQDNNVWFDLGTLNAPDLVHPYRIHRTVRVFRNQDNLIPTNCANGIDVKPNVDTDALLGYLNSTVHAAVLELWGQSEGGGSLEITTGTLQQLPVVDVRAFSDADREAVVAAYRALVRDEANAQVRLDQAVLDALDVEIDAAAIIDAKETLIDDRLPSE